jgi:Fe2+ or Zn2+ uptake regulation protein
MADVENLLRKRLKASGLRVTAPRLVILEYVGAHPHSTAEQVITAARGRLGSVSIQAVYDVLNACERGGLIRRIENAGHPAQFETRVGDGHHHIVCRNCGLTEDVDHVVGEAPCVDPPDTYGYVIDRSEVVFWGYCPACTADLAVPAS